MPSVVDEEKGEETYEEGKEDDTVVDEFVSQNGFEFVDVKLGQPDAGNLQRKSNLDEDAYDYEYNDGTIQSLRCELTYDGSSL
jgi:hypothetical protein